MAIEPSDLLLGVHVAAGTSALLLGPLVLVARRWSRRQAAPAAGYQAAIAVLTTSALGLVCLAPSRLWWLAPFAIGTQAAVIGGWVLGRRESGGGATPGRIRLMGGSYVSLITALLVVSWGSNILAWVLPSIVGVVVVESAAARVGRRAN